MVLSHHSSMVTIVSAALGGKSDGPSAPKGMGDRKNLAAGHADVNSAVLAINAAMRIGG